MVKERDQIEIRKNPITAGYSPTHSQRNLATDDLPRSRNLSSPNAGLESPVSTPGNLNFHRSDDERETNNGNLLSKKPIAVAVNISPRNSTTLTYPFLTIGTDRGGRVWRRLRMRD